MDWTTFFIGLFSGFFLYGVLSSLLDVGRIGLYIREAEKNALVMLASAAESIAFIQSVKYKVMKEMGIPQNTIQATKNIDDYNFSAWKNAAVSKLLAAYPEKFRGLKRYVDWNTAMNFLDKVYVKGHKE
jgi:hypothetical protein|tara:strand:+ start:1206 stop:1592 length:387 start_codon:yes stop_codon:yes gene_type:complete